MVGTLRHFTIERLGDGVWAALHAMDPPAPDAWAISNAGIVDLGDRTLVFDTLTATDAATELRRVAEELHRPAAEHRGLQPRPLRPHVGREPVPGGDGHLERPSEGCHARRGPPGGRRLP